MPPYCYLNGKILPITEAKVGVYDLGLLRGLGIYEALMTYGKKPFRINDHLARFRRSAAFLGVEIPASDEEITDALRELIEKNGYDESIIRLLLTGGPAFAGIEYAPKMPTFYILVEKFEPLPAQLLEKGCSVTVHEHLRQFPKYKTTNYIQAVLLQKARKEAGALEILYMWKGRALEFATSNLFIVKDGTVITPGKDVLPGITRKVALELAREEFPVEERDVNVEELYAADEMFLTSSFKDIVPVVTVGERVIGGGAPGPVTKKMIELFHAYTRSHAESAAVPVAA